MKLTISAVFSAMILFLFVMSSQAQGDLTPPVLVDLQIEPAMVDTRGSAQIITFTAHITDDLSGFRYAAVSFEPLISTTQNLEIQFYERHRITGTELDGLYLNSATLPRYAAEGRWQMTWMGSSDAVGNGVSISGWSDDWPARFNDYHFANVVDTTATPTITPTPTWTPTPTRTPFPTGTPTPTVTPTSTPMPKLYLPVIERME